MSTLKQPRTGHFIKHGDSWMRVYAAIVGAMAGVAYKDDDDGLAGVKKFDLEQARELATLAVEVAETPTSDDDFAEARGR